MLKVAITGNIASGKSEVEKFFAEKGFKVIDTDKINHDILENDETTVNEILSLFPSDDIKDDSGRISREKLGKIVFFDDKKLKLLENILHKKILEKVDEFFIQNESEKTVFVSVPLLFETGQNILYDKIIFVTADENIRLERLIKRTGWTKEYAEKRISVQKDEKTKIEKSDYIVYNDSGLSDLYKNLENIKSELLLLC